MNRGTLGRRALLSGALASLACRHHRELPKSVSELLTLQDVLGDHPAEVASAGRVLWELESAVRAKGTASGETAIDVVSRVIFENFGFEREIADTDLRYVFLSDVLLGRRGSCVGLGSVYFALGQLLSLRLEGVVLPGHFFLREAGVPHRNIETLRRGEAMPDSWYETRYPVGPGMGSAYWQPLGSRQLQGVVAFNVGNERMRQARWLEAEHAFAFSVSRFEDFAEAHASLGRARHVLGELKGAARAYADAQRLAPELPGLAQNQQLLRAKPEHTIP